MKLLQNVSIVIKRSRSIISYIVSVKYLVTRSLGQIIIMRNLARSLKVVRSYINETL